MATRRKAEAASAPEKLNSSSAAKSANDAQMLQLEEGIRLFRAHRFREAKEAFAEVVKGPQRAVSQAARSHISVCERRLQKGVPDLVTAEDHYNFGIERLNARDLPSARRHLEAASTLRPNTEYIVYALAAAQSLSGDHLGAYENLRRAIELEPRNRTTARHDSDFANVAHNTLFAQLLHPERSPSR